MDLLSDAVKAASFARRQIELEYRLDSKDRLVPFPGSDEQARYVIYRFADGYLRWYRQDLDETIVATLEETPAALAFGQPERIISILAGQPMLKQAIPPRFVSGYFSRFPEPDEFEDVEGEPGKGFVVRQDGQTVAWAFSVRENSRSAEVAVETAAGYRRRGYARQVTAAWAYQVNSEGKRAFYSYKIDNTASAALAASLGVKIFAEVVGFD